MRTQCIFGIILGLITFNAFGMNTGIKNHSKGDVIAVRTEDQIAAWCDFNKQIINTQFNTLCVFNGNQESIE